MPKSLVAALVLVGLLVMLAPAARGKPTSDAPRIAAVKAIRTEVDAARKAGTLIEKKRVLGTDAARKSQTLVLDVDREGRPRLFARVFLLSSADGGATRLMATASYYDRAGVLRLVDLVERGSGPGPIRAEYYFDENGRQIGVKAKAGPEQIRLDPPFDRTPLASFAARP